MAPTIGRIVRFHPSYSPGAEWAAIVTKVVNNHCVCLTTFPPNDPPQVVRDCVHRDVQHPGNDCWTWPMPEEKAPAKAPKGGKGSSSPADPAGAGNAPEED